MSDAAAPDSNCPRWPHWPRRPLWHQAASRFGGVVTICALVGGCAAVIAYRDVVDRNRQNNLETVTSFVAQNFAVRRDLVRRQNDELRHDIAYMHLLDGGSAGRWEKLHAYLSTHRDHDDHVTLLTLADGRIAFRHSNNLGANFSELSGEAIKKAGRDSWYYEPAEKTVFLDVRAPIGSAGDGLGEIVSLTAVDQALLASLAPPGTDLFLAIKDEVVVASHQQIAGSAASPPHTASTIATIADMPGKQRLLAPFGAAPEAPRLVVRINPAEAVSAPLVVVSALAFLLLLAAALWITLGRWMRRTTERIATLGEASQQFAGGAATSGEANRLLQASCTRNDEITELSKTLGALMDTVAERQEEHLAYLQTLDLLEEAVVEIDSEGLLRRGSPGWARLFGQPVQPGEDFFASIWPEDVAAARKGFTALFAGAAQRLRMEFRVRRGEQQDRGSAWVACEIAPAIVGEDGTSFVRGILWDISPDKVAEALLFAEKERAQVTLESIGDAVITTDLQGRLEYLNPVAARLTGWPLEAARGRRLEEVFCVVDKDTRLPIDNSAGDFAELAGSHRGTVERSSLLLARDESEVLIEKSEAPIHDRLGHVIGKVLVFHDVGDRYRLMQEIEWRAGHDILTNLPNRLLLADRLAQAAAAANRNGTLVGVVMVDLDNFKPVNDKFGHASGDELLKHVASRLMNAVRGGDTVARLGGDEFVLLLTDMHDVALIETTLQRVLDELSTPYLMQGETITLSGSIGASVYPLDHENFDSLLRYADQAMYRAKQAGGNRMQLFDRSIDSQARANLQRVDQIRQAIEQDQLRLHYQPKVNMRTGEIVGLEALVRWQHPERGLLGPIEFLPLIEASELIVDIGEWVMHAALAQMAVWDEEGHAWPVSVNVAPRHMQIENFAARLQSILAAHPNVAPARLELEIIESTGIEDLHRVRLIMAECQALGVGFALDDFGTAYSSLAYLKRLPAKTLKIDQSFVRGMLEDEEDLAIVEAMVSLAKVFDRTVVAEGVETIEHGVMLMRLGCDLAQGYGIGRPLPAAAVPAWAAAFTPPPSWQLWADARWDLADFPLLVAQYDHANWISQILSVVHGEPLKMSAAELNDGHCCRFGRWYSGPGQSRYRHLPQFAELEGIHERVHALGQKIVSLCEGGEADSTTQLCTELQVLKDEILSKLATLQHAVASA
jgi:diguanylate cyclase (GGDEF)-like protein/PAS domain S-box-containing protein